MNNNTQQTIEQHALRTYAKMLQNCNPQWKEAVAKALGKETMITAWHKALAKKRQTAQLKDPPVGALSGGIRANVEKYKPSNSDADAIIAYLRSRFFVAQIGPGKGRGLVLLRSLTKHQADLAQENVTEDELQQIVGQVEALHNQITDLTERIISSRLLSSKEKEELERLRKDRNVIDQMSWQ